MSIIIEKNSKKNPCSIEALTTIARWWQQGITSGGFTWKGPGWTFGHKNEHLLGVGRGYDVFPSRGRNDDEVFQKPRVRN